MASFLSNLSPHLLYHTKSSSKGKTHQPIFTLTASHQTPESKTNFDTFVPLKITPSSNSLQAPPRLKESQLSSPAGNQDKGEKHDKEDFFVNLGFAVRTLREDMPLVFSKDINYDIYREDVTFTDPLNTFTGIENYKLIFWALRFHGKILFSDICLEVLRIWQPSENEILIRWNLRGVPRVPWEAKGQFQGTSRYKLDRKGKIYEHKVDNLAFNFPQRFRPAASVLDMITCPASPNLTFLWGPADEHQSSWVEFYKAVRGTLDKKGYSITQDGLVTCL